MDDNARYILAIAEEGSVSKAALAIHMSQSALSQRLKNEEHLLGVELFDRSRIPIQPTAAGQAYLQWAADSVRAEDALKAKLALLADGTVRHVDIGVSGARCAHVLADATLRFCRENPGCQPVFHEVGKREAITAAFAAHSIDFSALTPQPPEPSLFASEKLCEERYVYVAPSSWEIPCKLGDGAFPAVTVQDIADRPFIMPAYANRLVNIAEALFDLIAGKPRVAATCVSAVHQMQLVRMGLGATIETTAGSTDPDDPGLAFYDVEGIAGASPLYYSYRLDRERTPDELAFMAILRTTLQEYPLLNPID